MHYAAKWMLPGRRLELLMAQAAMWSSRAAGVATLQLSDFLFEPDPVDEAVVEPADPAVAAEFFNFKPRK